MEMKSSIEAYEINLIVGRVSCFTDRQVLFGRLLNRSPEKY